MYVCKRTISFWVTVLLFILLLLLLLLWTFCRIFVNQHAKKKIPSNANNSIAHLTQHAQYNGMMRLGYVICVYYEYALHHKCYIYLLPKQIFSILDCCFTCHSSVRFFFFFSRTVVNDKQTEENTLYRDIYFLFFLFKCESRLYRKHMTFYCLVVNGENSTLSMFKKKKCENHFAILPNCQKSDYDAFL